MTAVPPGWPAEVRPPDAPDWVASALGWLLDLAPPEYRGYPVLRRHPVALARLVVLHVEAGQEAVRHGLERARPQLRPVLPAEVVAQAVDVLIAEQRRLAGVRRAAGLVEDALRGRRFVPRW